MPPVVPAYENEVGVRPSVHRLQGDERARCTAIVLHTYAQNHDVDLNEVELTLQYKRVFQEDCENCEDIDRYDEKIHENLKIRGDLTEAERKKLFHIAHQCSVHKMLEAGIEIESDLAANGGEE